MHPNFWAVRRVSSKVYAMQCDAGGLWDSYSLRLRRPFSLLLSVFLFYSFFLRTRNVCDVCFSLSLSVFLWWHLSAYKHAELEGVARRIGVVCRWVALPACRRAASARCGGGEFWYYCPQLSVVLTCGWGGRGSFVGPPEFQVRFWF